MKRVLYICSFPVSWGDGLLGVELLRDFKRENPLSICYAFLHETSCRLFGSHIVYEGIVDTLIPICSRIYSDSQLLFSYILRHIGDLDFTDVILHWNYHDMDNFLSDNFSEANIQIHRAAIGGLVSNKCLEYVKVVSPKGIYKALDISDSILPITDLFDNNKKIVGIFPGSSSVLNTITSVGMSQVLDMLDDKYNILFMGIESGVFSSHVLRESMVWDNVINLLGISSLKQKLILDLCDVIVLTSGAIVHPILYPRKVILLNSARQHLQAYANLFSCDYRVVNPTIACYPCLDTHNLGNVCKKSQSHTPICLDCCINAKGLISAIEELI